MRKYDVGELVAFKDCRNSNVYLIGDCEVRQGRYTLVDRITGELLRHIRYYELWRTYDVGDEVFDDHNRIGIIYRSEPCSDTVDVVFEAPSTKQLNHPNAYEMLPDGSFVTRVQRQLLRRTGAKRVMKYEALKFDSDEFEELLLEGL